MGKYTPLRSYLAGQDKDRVPMSFDQIERIIGEKLPASKKYPAWWSNNPSNNPMTREWVAAGFQSEDVDVAGESVVFARVQPLVHSAPLGGFGESPQAEFDSSACRHPLFGILKGVIKIPPGVDLTDPAFPDWDEYLDQKYGKAVSEDD